MGKPAGVQIKRWFLTLALLLLVVNSIAVISLFLVYGYVNDIKAVYQPIVKSSSTINEKIMAAQIDLYKYLSEYQKDLGTVFSKTKELQNEIEKIKSLVKENEIKSIDVSMLDGTFESTKRFEKAISQLKKVEEQEFVDWEKVNDLRNYAMDIGNETLNNAARVANEINLLITKQNIHVTLVTLIVVCTLFVFFVISIIIMIQLNYWWRHFEDLILEL
jgi:hypothetical protein